MKVDTNGHGGVEAFFTAELSKLLGRQVPVAIMWLDFADIDIPDPPYHKSVSEALIEEWQKTFNPVVAGFLVMNVRKDRKTALVDGRHRREMAIKNGHKGWWFISTDGLTLIEEATIFRFFQARKNMKTAEKLRALVISGDPASLALRSAVSSAGCCLPFEADTKRQKVTAADALVWLFERGGAAGVKRVLGLILDAWFGAPIALTGAMIRGLWVFISNDEVKGKLDWDVLKSAMKTEVPDVLIQRAKLAATQERCGVPYAMANIFRFFYNKKVKGRGRRVDTDFAHAPRKGAVSGPVPRQVSARLRPGVKMSIPAVPDHLKGEVDARFALKKENRLHTMRLSPGMVKDLRSLLNDGYMAGVIGKAFCVSGTTVTKISRALRADILAREES
jgi:hypothetical protein